MTGLPIRARRLAAGMRLGSRGWSRGRSGPGPETTTALTVPASNRLAKSPGAAETASRTDPCCPCRSRCGSAFADCRSSRPSGERPRQHAVPPRRRLSVRCDCATPKPVAESRRPLQRLGRAEACRASGHRQYVRMPPFAPQGDSIEKPRRISDLVNVRPRVLLIRCSWYKTGCGSKRADGACRQPVPAGRAPQRPLPP